MAKLKVHKLYLNSKKCEFALQEIKFLGHLVRKGSVRMDPSKVKAIKNWAEPNRVPQLRSFLRLAKYDQKGKFVVYTDNVATSCFESQKKLTPKQVRWQDFLAEFDFDLKYKPRRANQVVDTLSRNELEVFVATLSAVQGSILDEIKLALKDDSEAVRLMKRIARGKTRRFWMEDGIIYAMGNRPYAPHASGLRWKLLYEAHDAPTSDTQGRVRCLHSCPAAIIGQEWNEM
ncbi:uncharacterized protein LOC144707172 [Wolffia australiana]